LEQFWSFGYREIVFSLFSPSSQKNQFVVTLPFHRNRPRKSDLQRILKVLWLPGPVVPPMERAIQVGTSLELWFLRNNNFPVFVVIRKITIYHQTAFPPKSSAKVGFQLILKVLLLPGPVILPMERPVQVGTILELCFWRNNNFPGFHVIPICHQPFHRNRSRKSNLQRILKVILLQGLVLPPMERCLQVGTILELWFWRNSIFAGFPSYHQFPIFHQTAFQPKSSAKVGFQLILKVVLLPGPILPPMERSVQVGTFLELCFWRNNNSPVFPSSQKIQFRVTLHFNRNLPRKLDFQGILNVVSLLRSVLPPMERSVQVGTSLQL